MKTSTFNRIFENARTVNIQSNEWFNYAGFFWMQCTEKQLTQMRVLLKAAELQDNHEERRRMVHSE